MIESSQKVKLPTGRMIQFGSRKKEREATQSRKGIVKREHERTQRTIQEDVRESIRELMTVALLFVL